MNRILQLIGEREKRKITRTVDAEPLKIFEPPTNQSLLFENNDINTLIGQCDVKEEVVKTDIVKHIQQCKQDITLEKDNVKPRKTASLDRVFHRAFTQVIFAGRKNIEPKDLLVSLLSEGESYAFYFLMKNIHGTGSETM